jgi:hypothetical protein
MSASLKLGDIVFHLSEDVDSLIIPVPSSRTSADIVSQPGGTIVPGADGMLAVSEDRRAPVARRTMRDRYCTSR